VWCHSDAVQCQYDAVWCHSDAVQCQYDAVQCQHDAVWCHSDAVQCATYLLPESCQYQSNLQLKNVYFTAIGYLVDRSSTLVGILQDDFLLSNGLCLACVVEPAATQLLP